jgi:ribosomal protein L11 methyltransferase
MTTPRYPLVEVEIGEADADVVTARLFELGATGIEERDQTTFTKGPAAGRVLLVASFETDASAREAAESLRESDASLDPRVSELVGDAWRDEWKKYYEPFALTESITIRPPWRPAPPGAGRVLVLEPGRAFGTGLHATTALVAGILDASRASLRGAAVLDAGCGSGILSLVALALGADRAVAFDVDPEVVPIVRQNAEQNALANRVEVFAGTIADLRGTFPWVLANIEAKVLDEMAEDLARVLAPGGHLVLSGILLAEEDRMRHRFTSLRRPLKVARAPRRSTGGERAYDKDGWVALELVDR